MHDRKIRPRLEARLAKSSPELCAGLSKRLGRFVPRMLFGIQSSQDVKRSNIERLCTESLR